MDIVLSLIVGILFGCGGMSYKLAEKGGIHALEITFFLCLPGMVLFGAVLGWNEWRNLDWSLLLLGVFCGAQYLVIRFLNIAIHIGPFSPVWCAQSLSFIPVILYAWLFIGEKMSVWQHLSVLGAVGAIVAASVKPDSEKRTGKTRISFSYVILLTAILIFASVLNIVLKYASVHIVPGTNQTLLARGGNLLMFFCYFWMGIGCAMELTLGKNWRFNKYALWSSLQLSVFTLVSFCLILKVIARIPAITFFSVSNVTAIMFVCLCSVLFFHEKKTVSWYLTIGFSLLAILLNR